MKKYLFLLLLTFACIAETNAQWSIGSKDTTYTDPARSNRAVDVEIHYPALTTGTDVPVALDWPGFPVIIFGHGFVMGTDAYQFLWTELVPKGYVVILPKTEGSFAPNHQEFGNDLAFLADLMVAQNSNPSSVFYNKLNNQIALGGHSMGGGSSFLGAIATANISTLFNFAAAETSTSAIAAAASVTVPTLVFTGTEDCVAPPPTHQDLMYNNLGTNCKLLVNIIDGSHCGFGDSNFPCSTGESISCPLASYISRADQHAAVFDYLTPWLDNFLKGECTEWATLNTNLSDPQITYDLQCNNPDVCQCIDPTNFTVCTPTDVDLKILLEGAYDTGGTMRTDLTAVLPTTQPFSAAPYNYAGTENLATIPVNMVDWILVEARREWPDPTNNAKETVSIESKAGMLLNDGRIVGMDGSSPLAFDSLKTGLSYHFCVRHRNHLDVLTAEPIRIGASNQFDFTTNVAQALGTAQQKLSGDGFAYIYTGDYTQDGVIQVTDYDAWKGNPAILNTYYPTDGNMDAVIQTTDYDVWFLNKAKIGSPEVDY